MNCRERPAEVSLQLRSAHVSATTLNRNEIPRYGVRES